MDGIAGGCDRQAVTAAPVEITTKLQEAVRANVRRGERLIVKKHWEGQCDISRAIVIMNASVICSWHNGRASRRGDNVVGR